MRVFEPIAYLEWIAGRPDAATHDLGSSDLRSPSPDRGVVPPVLADRSDPTDGTVESLLADVYDHPESGVHVTAGATHANWLVGATCLSRADESAEPRVLVESPGYEPHAATPRGLGGRVERFERPAGRLDPDTVDEALTPDTELVVCTNRHNPTGRLADRGTLRAVAERVADVDATLLVDEVYAPYGTNAGTGPFGGVTAAGLPNTVVAGSLTKFFGLGGLRVGWVLGEASTVERMERVGWHLPVVAGPSRALARRALAHREALSARAHERVAENHALLSAFLDDRSDLSGTVHEGCPFALLAHEAADGDRVARRAWDESVLVVPGRFFDRPGAVRVSLGLAPEEMERALSAFGTALDAL
ncbi:pyridoxal phosphate-dependent aminotransferase [Halomarina litorea]|uniref:pyridoxal phosphate-dependent aminotransferase n=1 Tax=Halomarina litorea TaxID=2961595 RepID=UPI0020C314B4|nr:pyridoxal phosphate-dependent aminotransferase [Halomarina sp. BCD28]